jgi:DNA-directed RNA polymerase specialized sigma24 family protein
MVPSECAINISEFTSRRGLRADASSGFAWELIMVDPEAHGAPSEFPSTQWSRVVAAADLAAPDARVALEELCTAYWYPIYAFIRRKGNDAEKSLDLTQSYFARLLEKRVLAAADPRKGRFRSFIRTDCEHFLISEHRRDKAVRRGGNIGLLSIDAQNAEGRYRFEPADSMTPERLFDYAWGVTLLGSVLDILAVEYAKSDRAELFAHLKVVLTEGKGAVSGATLAERTGTTEGAVYKAVHELRKRYREILKDQIAATLDDPAQIDDEIRDLFKAMRR